MDEFDKRYGDGPFRDWEIPGGFMSGPVPEVWEDFSDGPFASWFRLPGGRELCIYVRCVAPRGDLDAVGWGNVRYDLFDLRQFPDSYEDALAMHCDTNAGDVLQASKITWSQRMPFAGRLIRVLRIQLFCNQSFGTLPSDDHFEIIGWRAKLSTSRSETEIDRIPDTPEVERFGPYRGISLRAPRGWHWKSDPDEVQDGRDRFRIEPDDGAETLWVDCATFVGGRRRVPQLIKDVEASFERPNPWVHWEPTYPPERPKVLHGGDTLLVRRSKEKDDTGTTRRLSMYRVGHRRDAAFCAMFHLCSPADRLHEQRFIHSEAICLEEIRNANIFFPDV